LAHCYSELVLFAASTDGSMSFGDGGAVVLQESKRSYFTFFFWGIGLFGGLWVGITQKSMYG
jgi:hypothetical protein